MSLGRRHAVCPIIFAATPTLNWPSAHSLSGPLGLGDTASLGLGDTPFTPPSWLRTLPSLVLLQSKCPSVPRGTGFCHEHQDWGAPGFAPWSRGCRAASRPAYSAACLGASLTCRGKEYHNLVSRLGMDTRGHWKSSPGNTLVPTASPGMQRTQSQVSPPTCGERRKPSPTCCVALTAHSPTVLAPTFPQIEAGRSPVGTDAAG